jgi:NAD(P) transhydrogenase subunit alpha
LGRRHPLEKHIQARAGNGASDRDSRSLTMFQLTITGLVAVYIFMLAAFTGYEVISRVPAILHTPLMSGSNFIHGIVVVGALYTLLTANSLTAQVIGFVGVILGAANAAGGFVVTRRMLDMFKASAQR